ncbi:hypothetical protein KK141_06585 [Dyella sp. LX-66]|uniref:hypothetical protein n=1 Tax=unclassified Dyella TaxID=2634549 RepID=UPI001BE0DF06|nr:MULTISPECIES: hypothetical protein [unclassified Dyella]MBT2116628.1 hypothetical protein [Dyella sp. LX-1]MBT2139192.1 hypothetical protein [Dyella sp. LX-66]
MTALSAILYFLTEHPFWSWPVLMLVGIVLSHWLARWTGKPGWYGLILAFFIYGVINVFVAHIFNALFLQAFGVEGTAVITHAEETSSTLNDQNVWEFDGVLKTADGQDVVVKFDTMSATIYPITNAIMIPPQGEIFVVRYIPGFPRNFVVMREQSSYGKRYQLAEDREPVEKAAAQFAVSPGNKAFIAEYRSALATFIEKHRHDADPGLIMDYQARLDALPSAN